MGNYLEFGGIGLGLGLSTDIGSIRIMYRYAIEELRQWRKKPNRKPLIIRGARQVGKTWLMKTFGEEEFKQTAYINFDHNKSLQLLFSGDFNLKRIISGLEIEVGHPITPETLLIFDEVQEVPQALTSLKYFYENAPEYTILCAGSLLGVAMHAGSSFPVGKVEFLDLYPLSYPEFLLAIGMSRYVDILREGQWETAGAFKLHYTDALKRYYYIGGMPEVVQSYVENQNFLEVRAIQRNILEAYEQDFSKHAPSGIVPRLRMLWTSIPTQLAREQKKFMYGLVKNGARARDYELALSWLIDSGLVYQIHRASVPRLPLKAYEDTKAFKLFHVDVGLLSCMVGAPPNILLNGNDLFQEFKGALTEQYVCQQLKTIKNLQTYYWTASQGTAEIDFVVDNGLQVIPIEVKAEVNLRAKSLKVYREQFNPLLSIRTSLADYRFDPGLLNLPLWAFPFWDFFANSSNY